MKTSIIDLPCPLQCFSFLQLVRDNACSPLILACKELFCFHLRCWSEILFEIIVHRLHLWVVLPYLSSSNGPPLLYPLWQDQSIWNPWDTEVKDLTEWEDWGDSQSSKKRQFSHLQVAFMTYCGRRKVKETWGQMHFMHGRIFPSVSKMHAYLLYPHPKLLIFPLLICSFSLNHFLIFFQSSSKLGHSASKLLKSVALSGTAISFRFRQILLERIVQK